MRRARRSRRRLPMDVRILRALRTYGPLTFRQLQDKVGSDSRGPYSMLVLSNFIKRTGLSKVFGDTIQSLIYRGEVRVNRWNKLCLVKEETCQDNQSR